MIRVRARAKSIFEWQNISEHEYIHIQDLENHQRVSGSIVGFLNSSCFMMVPVAWCQNRKL